MAVPKNVVEKVCEINVTLSSPVEVEEELFLLGMNGDIFKMSEGILKSEWNLGGQPSGLAIDDKYNFFVADLAHQSILAHNYEDKLEDGMTELPKEHNGIPLIGPSSVLCVNKPSDSGPFGEVNIENPNGSVFFLEADEEEGIFPLKPLALNCLAYPIGLALTQDEKYLYVCEMCKNRLLKFNINANSNVTSFSTFYQFSGLFGPVSVAISASELIYVARFEFNFLSNEGSICVLNKLGEFIEEIKVPNAPQITGISFSKIKPSALYLTESSADNLSCCYKVHIQNEEPEDKTNKSIFN